MAKADGVYRITEVIGTSETSWEDAAKRAVQAAFAARYLRSGSKRAIAAGSSETSWIRHSGSFTGSPFIGCPSSGDSPMRRFGLMKRKPSKSNQVLLEYRFI